MRTTHLKAITKYPEVNEVLVCWAGKAEEAIGQNLLGLYLFGSLAYGDFIPKRSDIDLMAVTKKPLSSIELEKIKQLHLNIEEKFPAWRDRVECSYLPKNLMNEKLPPKQTRPYFGNSTWYDRADYGNEWLINQYFLYHNSIVLVGPEYKSLMVAPPDLREVQKASIRDLFDEWEPKINDAHWLENSHYQSYLVLNLCRILYTMDNAKLGSKKVAAEWVKKTFNKWHGLIEEAEAWEYSKEMKQQEKAIAFLRFVIKHASGRNF
jgi:predicted nucleotidyltransferase